MSTSKRRKFNPPLDEITYLWADTFTSFTFTFPMDFSRFIIIPRDYPFVVVSGPWDNTINPLPFTQPIQFGDINSFLKIAPHFMPYSPFWKKHPLLLIFLSHRVHPQKNPRYDPLVAISTPSAQQNSSFSFYSILNKYLVGGFPWG